MGQLVEFPYPAIDVGGSAPASYWLVGPGKHGVAALVRGLHSRTVRLTVTLIERDDEKMLQIAPTESKRSRPTLRRKRQRSCEFAR